MRNLTIFTCIWVLFGCGSSTSKQTNEQVEAPLAEVALNVNMDEITSSVDIKLSDILDDIKIVPIEEKIPLQSFYHAVTDSSIIINNKNEILQYDHTGKFIKKIISKGRGPKEFMNVRSIFVTPGINKLYFSECSNKALKSVDLTSGEIVSIMPEDIISVKHVSPQGVVYYKYLYGDEKNNAANTLYRVTNMQGEAFNPVLKEVPPRCAWKYGFLGRGNEVAFLDHGYSDTLYLVNGISKKAKAVLQMANLKESDGAINNLSPEIWYKEGILLSCTKYWQKKMAGPMIKSEATKTEWKEPQLMQLYLLDNLNKPHTVSSVYLDPLGLKIESLNYMAAVNQQKKQNLSNIFPTITGEWGYYVFEADKFKQIIQEAIVSSSISPQVKENLLKLDSTLTEESNPVFIIGKIK